MLDVRVDDDFFFDEHFVGRRVVVVFVIHFLVEAHEVFGFEGNLGNHNS